MTEIIIPMGVYKISHNPSILTSIGLGSCVGIIIYDQKKKLGALAHAMLPRYKEGRDKKNPAKYVDTVIYLMVDDLVSEGCSKKNLKAKLVGGANMFANIGNGTMDVGTRNIESARETLKKEGIRIASEDVGGTSGRTVKFDIKEMRVTVTQIGKEPVDI